MRNVTDRRSNPFGVRPPCESPCSTDGPEAVFGYGDANADVHVIGDHPGVHGGRETGVPFTGTDSGTEIQRVLDAAGLLADVGDAPTLRNCFLSYLHPCCVPDDGTPSEADYARLEPTFDSELRAIAAHVLVPVGDRATQRVLKAYTAKAERLEPDAMALHADEIRGSGFLVLPVAEPAEWEPGYREALIDALEALLDRDYRQTADLGRFLATDDMYWVR